MLPDDARSRTAPGLALLALHARVRDFTQARLAEALAQDKSLLQTWSLRGAPFCLLTSDAWVFTTGALPTTGCAAPDR